MEAEGDAWAELMKASFGMVNTGLLVSETMIATGCVIGARMTILGNAARSPADGDYTKIGSMVLEKAIAFSKVGQVLVDEWSAMLIDASEQARYHGGSVLDGRSLGARDFLGLAERWLANGTRMITRTMETGGLALAPVHAACSSDERWRSGEGILSSCRSRLKSPPRLNDVKAAVRAT